MRPTPHHITSRREKLVGYTVIQEMQGQNRCWGILKPKDVWTLKSGGKGLVGRIYYSKTGAGWCSWRGSHESTFQNFCTQIKYSNQLISSQTMICLYLLWVCLIKWSQVQFVFAFWGLLSNVMQLYRNVSIQPVLILAHHIPTFYHVPFVSYMKGWAGRCEKPYLTHNRPFSICGWRKKPSL